MTDPRDQIDYLHERTPAEIAKGAERLRAWLEKGRRDLETRQAEEEEPESRESRE